MASDAPPLACPPPTAKLTTDRLTGDGGPASRRRAAGPCSGNSGLETGWTTLSPAYGHAAGLVLGGDGSHNRLMQGSRSHASWAGIGCR
jgi:hypothetical protein